MDISLNAKYGKSCKLENGSNAASQRTLEFGFTERLERKHDVNIA